MRKIKLIWDFRGEAAAKTAEHQDIHLKRIFRKREKITLEKQVAKPQLENACYRFYCSRRKRYDSI